METTETGTDELNIPHATNELTEALAAMEKRKATGENWQITTR